MSNIVKCVLRINADEEKANEIKNFVQGGARDMDFQKIIPMSADLLIEASSRTGQGVDYLILILKLERARGEDIEEIRGKIKRIESLPDFDRIKELGFKAISNLLKYGFTNCYDWSICNWGTQWNTMYSEAIGDKIYFHAANNFPEPVIKHLSEIFPDVEFEYKYADEDLGTNCGFGSIKDGVYECGDFETENDAMKFSIDMWGAQDEYELVNGNFVYKNK